MGMEGFSAAFCGNAGGFAAEGGLPTLCCSESAWLGVYVVFFFLLLERFFEIHRMAISCPPAHLPAAFLVKRICTGFVSLAYLILLGLVAARATTPPPVLLWSLSAHALFWGMSHCLLHMEFNRFLPQCRLSVRGFWNAGGVEGIARAFAFLAQLTTSTAGADPFTFGAFLKNDGGFSGFLYFFALLIYGATSACQVLLFAVCLLYPNDLPLELLPFVARLLTQGSATLPFYTLPQPARRAGDYKGMACIGVSREVIATGDPMSALTDVDGKEEGVCSLLLLPSAPSPPNTLEVSILSVVLTEVQPASVVHAEYKLQMRYAGRAPWVTRRRFRSFVELNRKLHAAFPAFVYPELTAILPRLPPRDHFSDHQLSLQYLERRRRGLESFLRAVVSETAFWISDLLTFLEVPEDLRAALSTQRLIRLNELQHCYQSNAAVLAVRPPEHACVATSLGGNGEASVKFPLLPSPSHTGTAGQWFPPAMLRSEASEAAAEEGSCSALTAEIWRLRICRDAKVPFVVHDIRCSTQHGIFYSARRYREFIQLRHKLRRELCVSLPRLPGRLVSSKREYLFHEQRRLHLEMWLKQILADGACAESPTVLAFLGVVNEEGSPTDDGSDHKTSAYNAKIEERERFPSYMISVASFKRRNADKVLRLLVLRSDAHSERHWEFEVTERQIQDLHTELCRVFNSHDIQLVPDIPHKSLRFIATTPESLQAGYELFLGEICRNYPTFCCKALRDFLHEPPASTATD